MFKQIERSNCAVFFQIIEGSRLNSKQLARGVRSLDKLMSLKQTTLLTFSFDWLKDFRRHYEWPVIFQNIVSNRLLTALTAIKAANRVTCDNRESFLSCLVFEPELSSISKIFERVN